MQSTKSGLTAFAYLGVDVTDRFSRAARAMDVCGLEPNGAGLIAHFWKWLWGPPGTVNVSNILDEVRAARSLMLDAPQGLAQLGRSIRCSERALGAAAKTGDTRPPLTQVYGGFICSSLELFAAFQGAGFEISPTSLAGVCEVYPAAIWSRLARRIPNKRRLPGRETRAALMCGLGVGLPCAVPTHDQLDACAAALLGAAADGRISGMTVAPVGDAVYWDAAHGCLREGPILVAHLDPALTASLEAIAQPWTSILPQARPHHARPAELRIKGDTTTQIVGRPVLAGMTYESRAAELLGQPRTQFPNFGYELYIPNVLREFLRQQRKVPDHEFEPFFHQNAPQISVAFYSAAWNLCRRGILRLGIKAYGQQATEDGSGGNGYSVTPFGRQWLSESNRDDYVPTEPERFGQLLSKFKRALAQLFKNAVKKPSAAIARMPTWHVAQCVVPLQNRFSS
jgi:hypothetical protein